MLYCRPELLAADPDDIVFIPEGEKDVESLRDVGLVATCNPGGAGKWREEYSEDLRGRHGCILPDNADEGHKHAVQVARSLHAVARSVKILELPRLPDKGDVSDWLTAGGTPEDLAALADAAPPFNPSSFRNSESYMLGGSEESPGLKIVPSRACLRRGLVAS